MNTPFELYAKTAEQHALNEHHLRLDASSIHIIDKILQGEKEKADPSTRSALVVCYGAWIGQWMVNRLQAVWCGIDEPTPPKILIQGVFYSPMDKVDQILRGQSIDSFEQLLSDLVSKTESLQNAADRQVIEHNKRAWDANVDDLRFVRPDEFPATREEAIASLDVWLRDELSKRNCNVLCLASGGGTHGPLFAIAGAHVTILDISVRQLAIDTEVAERFQLPIRTVESSMDDLSMFEDESFDLVVQPVSSCYLKNLDKMYHEVARVTRKGGLYVSQHKQPTALQSNLSWHKNHGYGVITPCYEGHLATKPHSSHRFRESNAMEFIHTLDQLLGGLCRSGFSIEDFVEPPQSDAWSSENSFEHFARYLPPYLKIKARRK